MKKTSRADLSIFFYGFILWIMESASAQGITKLYFFTREGEFFKTLYDEIARVQFPGKKLPIAEVLEVSRLSTFLPSCSEISLDECMRIWNQYETQSMAALMKSFHVRLYRMQKYFDRHGIDPEEKIRKPWEDKRVQALFQDQEFIDTVTAEKEKKKRLLQHYLAAKGFAGKEIRINPESADRQEQGKNKIRLESERRQEQGKNKFSSEGEDRQEQGENKIGVVDIGWRGTIQDNLCYLYPENKITGYYMGLQPFISPQPPNSKKYGYINAAPISKVILMFVTPIEMLCNSAQGSTVAYKEKDGRVYALKKNERHEDKVYFQYAQKKQQEIAARVRQYCHQAVHASWGGHACVFQTCSEETKTAKWLHQKAFLALYRFAAWPDRDTADAYFSLKHNEEFGMGCWLDKRNVPGLLQFGKVIMGFYKKDRWIEFLKQTTWPQGYFVKYRLYPFLVLYNIALLYVNRTRIEQAQHRNKCGIESYR